VQAKLIFVLQTIMEPHSSFLSILKILEFK